MELQSATEHDSYIDMDEGGNMDAMEQESGGAESTFDVEELEVLACWRKEWAQAKKIKKATVLSSILEEIMGLERNRGLRPVEIHSKAEEIKTWLKKPIQIWKPHITLWSAYKYSARAVIWELYHNCIQAKLVAWKDGEGDRLDKSQIVLYQQALSAFIQDDLTEAQLQAAADVANKWNGPEGPSVDTKAQNATKYGVKYFHNFAEEMWRYCGMRIEYVGAVFEEEAAVDEGSEHADKPIVKSRRADPVDLVMNAQPGSDVANGSGIYDGTLQNPAMAVPFKCLGGLQAQMISGHHLPQDFIWTIDPSHMHLSTAKELLTFWQAWQETHPDDISQFQYWLDHLGELQPPVDLAARPLEIARCRQSHSKTPARGCSRSKTPAHHVNQSSTAEKGKGQQRTPAFSKDDRTHCNNSAQSSMDDDADEGNNCSNSYSQTTAHPADGAKTALKGHGQKRMWVDTPAQVHHPTASNIP
ncbi:hypothetical protein F5141DRAFT_1065835 [Pisolithus sp. B1]|nr:hypothetical protein F5141DRAFT_1065835 [Pisolithus sp. B1]